MFLREIFNKKETHKSHEDMVYELSLALEHLQYKAIPCTRNSYRQDTANTSTKTQKHVHVYAKPNGSGKELYSVNIDGTGHDGSSGKIIPSSHADYLRNLGFNINLNNALESLDYSGLSSESYEILLLEDSIDLGEFKQTSSKFHRISRF